MTRSTYLHSDLLPENLYGHTKKVQLLRASLDRLRVNKAGAGLRILDVGCGNGRAVTRFLARIGDQVTGIDLHVPSIDYAKSHFANDGLHFELRSVEELASVAGTFDAVVLADVLEHVVDPMQTLEMARRLLVDDGRVLVSIPNGRGPFEIESSVRRVFVVGWMLSVIAKVISRIGRLVSMQPPTVSESADTVPYNASSGHLHFFTRSRMQEMADRAGFQLVDWRNLAFLCGPFSGEMLPASRAVCRWNTDVADKLSSWAVSAWYFELMPKNARVKP